ncbi:MAG: 3-hydroxyacyl-CoA dehydrogenase [Thermoanaerobaculia bacterium]|nr:3-hydroxyacyl-CoA dehydrogenase [Thermoanaerobaculia bacterium]
MAEFGHVAVVGTGVMGRGIAQILAQAGTTVRLVDAREGAAAAARSAIGEQLNKLVEKGKLSADESAGTFGRLVVTEGLADLAGAELVIEAIVEDLAAKIALFQDLEAVLSDTAILATNTSSLSVTKIAAACRRPERVAGLHFFNPVPLMKVAEVIGGARTEATILDRLVALVEGAGHAAVRAQDTPGFVVNHAGRAYPTEALRIVGEGIAEFHQVDAVLREAAQFRLGPFELLDLTALDVSHPVMESIYEQYYQEPRYRPSVIMRQRLAAGLLGRKVGRGFYSYESGGTRQSPADLVAAGGEVPASVWVGGGEPEDVARLSALVRRLGVSVEVGDRPSPGVLAVVCPLGSDATSTAMQFGLDARLTVAIDPLHGFERWRTLMVTPVTSDTARESAQHLFSLDGIPVTVIHDSPGFIAQRVLAMVVNLGCDIVQQRVCSPRDLDTAVRLGLGYPKGPLAWGDELGPGRVLQILERMSAFYGDPRYRPSPWLKRRAWLGISLLT